MDSVLFLHPVPTAMVLVMAFWALADAISARREKRARVTMRARRERSRRS